MTAPAAIGLDVQTHAQEIRIAATAGLVVLTLALRSVAGGGMGLRVTSGDQCLADLRVQPGPPGQTSDAPGQTD